MVQTYAVNPWKFPSFGGSSGSKAPKSAPTAGSKKVSSKSAAPEEKRPKKDMRWGGRPDPSPESYVDEKADFWKAGWRVGKKK